MNLYSDFELNLEAFKADYRDCSDFLLRKAEVNGKRAFFCVMDGLVNSLQLGETVIEPILKSRLSFKSGGEHMKKLRECVVTSLEINEAKSFEDCAYFLMSGFLVFVLEGCSFALVFGVQEWSKRTTDEPTNEAMVKARRSASLKRLTIIKPLSESALKLPI